MEGLVRTETLATEKAWWLPGAAAWTPCPLAASSPFLTELQLFKKIRLYPQMPGQCCLLPVRRGILISLRWKRKLKTTTWVNADAESQLKSEALLRASDAKDSQTSQGGHWIFVPLHATLKEQAAGISELLAFMPVRGKRTSQEHTGPYPAGAHPNRSLNKGRIINQLNNNKSIEVLCARTNGWVR